MAEILRVCSHECNTRMCEWSRVYTDASSASWSSVLIFLSRHWSAVLAILWPPSSPMPHRKVKIVYFGRDNLVADIIVIASLDIVENCLPKD